MAYEKAIRASDFPMFAAAVLVGGGGLDELGRVASIADRIAAHVKAGGLPVRSAPLFEVPPAGSAIDWDHAVIFLSDFRAWVAKSGPAITGAKTWADALSDSMQWNDQPEPGSQVITGTPKGRPATVPDEKTVQADANAIGWELYRLNARMPVKKSITPKLAAKYGAGEMTVQDRYAMKSVKEHIETQKQLKQQK